MEENIVLNVDGRQINVCLADDILMTSDFINTINLRIQIGDCRDFIQVQYDDLNYCWSLDCEGNTAAELVENMFLAQFSNDELYTELYTKIDGGYKEKSDFYCDLENDTIPHLMDEICAFASFCYGEVDGRE